jgi:hypothetical protein
LFKEYSLYGDYGLGFIARKRVLMPDFCYRSGNGEEWQRVQCPLPGESRWTQSIYAGSWPAKGGIVAEAAEEAPFPCWFEGMPIIVIACALCSMDML